MISIIPKYQTNNINRIIPIIHNQCFFVKDVFIMPPKLIKFYDFLIDQVLVDWVEYRFGAELTITKNESG
jgi:hypothetical protein